MSIHKTGNKETAPTERHSPCAVFSLSLLPISRMQRRTYLRRMDWWICEGERKGEGGRGSANAHVSAHARQRGGMNAPPLLEDALPLRCSIFSPIRIPEIVFPLKDPCLHQSCSTSRLLQCLPRGYPHACDFVVTWHFCEPMPAHPETLNPKP